MLKVLHLFLDKKDNSVTYFLLMIKGKNVIWLPIDKLMYESYKKNGMPEI